MKNVLALSLAGLLLNACCSAKPAPAQPEPAAGNDAAKRYDEYPNGNPRIIDIDMTVAQACGMDTSRTYFGFGSSDVEAVNEAVAGEVATCMTTGPLAGKSVVVLGFADERGPADYNLELGMKRAESMADALVKAGVARERIYVASYGEIPRERATEADFARDRRVTLRVLR